MIPAMLLKVRTWRLIWHWFMLLTSLCGYFIWKTRSTMESFLCNSYFKHDNCNLMLTLYSLQQLFSLNHVKSACCKSSLLVSIVIVTWCRIHLTKPCRISMPLIITTVKNGILFVPNLYYHKYTAAFMICVHLACISWVILLIIMSYLRWTSIHLSFAVQLALVWHCVDLWFYYITKFDITFCCCWCASHKAMHYVAS